MAERNLDIDYPIQKVKGLRRYEFKGKRFFTRKGAENYRADYIIFQYTVFRSRA